MGWWKSSVLPDWMAAALLQQQRDRIAAEARMKEQRAQILQEPPLLFVDVDPAQASAASPKEAKFYSARNSVAANPVARIETRTPKIDGMQNKVLNTVDKPAVEPAPAPLIPSAPKEPKPAPADPPPEPVTQLARFADPQKLPAGDMQLGKPAENPVNPSAKPVAANAASDGGETRPRTLADARRKAGLAPAEKTKQEGGVKLRLDFAALDAKALPFGDYDAEVIEAIRYRWHVLVRDHSQISLKTGKVVVIFRLMDDGRVTNVAVAENTAGEISALICQRAVVDPAPFKPWPLALRRVVGANFRYAQFTFFYD